MRCKGCNTELTDADMMRIDEVGAHLDLCSQCYSHSELARKDSYEPTWEVPALRPTLRDHKENFDAFVEKHGLMFSWSKGMGFMTPEKRQRHMYNKTFALYMDHLESGYTPLKALEMSTGIKLTHYLDKNRLTA